MILFFPRKRFASMRWLQPGGCAVPNHLQRDGENNPVQTDTSPFVPHPMPQVEPVIKATLPPIQVPIAVLSKLAQ
jgi:hypothetical protein